MRIIKQSITDITKAYYAPRSKKILNLIDQLKIKKNVRFTLGGCFVLKEKNHIILRKEEKN